MRWWLLLPVLGACSENYSKCNSLCWENGFSGGYTTDGYHTEVTCHCEVDREGEREGLTQEQCYDYCEERDVAGPYLVSPTECWCSGADPA